MHPYIYVYSFYYEHTNSLVTHINNFLQLTLRNPHSFFISFHTSWLYLFSAGKCILCFEKTVVIKEAGWLVDSDVKSVNGVVRSEFLGLELLILLV